MASQAMPRRREAPVRPSETPAPLTHARNALLAPDEPALTPATELALLSHERWHIEEVIQNIAGLDRGPHADAASGALWVIAFPRVVARSSSSSKHLPIVLRDVPCSGNQRARIVCATFFYTNTIILYEEQRSLFHRILLTS
jgi:hypothetical protein